VAARIRHELSTEVDLVHGPYGQYKVLVDGEVVIDGGSLAFLGVLPSMPTIMETVRTRLAKNG